MKVKITHIYSDDQGITWNKQTSIYDGVFRIETEYQKHNGNSYWLKVHQNNGVIKTTDYIEINQTKFSYDEIEVLQ